MEKKILIRGAAIVVAGIAVSTFAAQHLLDAAPVKTSELRQPVAQEPGGEVVGAGIISTGTKRVAAERDPVMLQLESERGTAEINLTALQDEDHTSAARPGDPDLTQREALAAPEPQAAGPQAAAEPPELGPGVPETAEAAVAGTESHEIDTSIAEPDCTPSLTLAPGIDALIELAIKAPCHGGERLVISHDDLAFSATLSPSGDYAAFVPALSSDAKVDVVIGDDVVLQEHAQIDGLEDLLRVALQWSGDAPLAMHAYHRGAAYGKAGHLNALQPFDSELDEAFLIALGGAGDAHQMRAQVYSVPIANAADARLEVEVQFSDTACGGALSAHVLQSVGGEDADVTEIDMALPDCPAGEGSLVMALPLVQQDTGLVAALPGRD